MSFIKTAFFVKNVPPAERAIRIVAAVLGASLGIALLSSPLRWIAAGSALGFGVTGIVGFCPMCAMVGRRIARTSR